MRVVTEVTINARRESVWQTFLSVDRWPEWSPWRLRLPQRAAMEVGMPFSVFVPLPLLPRLRLRFDCRVSALENPSMLCWTGRALGIHGSHRFTFEDAADGGCRLVSEEEFRGHLALLLWPGRPLIRSQATTFLSRLREAAAAQTRPPAAQPGG